MCPCSWALEICNSIGIWTYLGSVTVESVGGFRHFAFWRHRFKLATFFIAPKNCIFWGASFKLTTNLATLNSEKLQGFRGTPLSHCYTLLIIVTGEFAYSLCISKNAENKRNSVLFDRHKHRDSVGPFWRPDSVSGSPTHVPLTPGAAHKIIYLEHIFGTYIWVHIHE